MKKTFRFATDLDQSCEVDILKVTAKTVKFIVYGEEKRAKIHKSPYGGSFFFPLGSYSMAPVVSL